MLGLGIAIVFACYILKNVNSPAKVLFAQFCFMLFSQALISILGAPSFIMYLGDLCNIIVLLHLIYQNRLFYIRKSMLNIMICILLFFLIGIITAITNSVKIYFIIWFLLNYLRFIIFTVAVLAYWKNIYTIKIINNLFPLLVINMLVSFFQYFQHVYSPDWIGGLLGNCYGVNAYSLMLFMFSSAYYIDSFINKKEKVYKVLLALISIFSCVIIADLKVFYFIFIVETVVILIQNRMGMRTILLFIIGSISAVMIYFVCLSLYNSQNIFDINYIMYYLTESSYSYSTTSINRTDGISIINRVFGFTKDEQLFGLGLGAGEYNSYFSSDIYSRYGDMHYIWFLYAWMYLETGIVGLVLFFLMLTFLLIYIWRNKGKNATSFQKIACSMLVAAYILTFYSSSLRGDSAYIFYAFIGIAIKECLERRNQCEMAKFKNEIF